MTDADIIAIRDEHLPSQGESFDSLAFGRAVLAAVSAERDALRALYLRAINEANGLTNYVEDRPELRRAERRIAKIEEDARPLLSTKLARPATSSAPPQSEDLEAARLALHEIAEEWAGAECGQPVYAQEAYAIGLAKRMGEMAARARDAIGRPAARQSRLMHNGGATLSGNNNLGDI